MKLFKFLKSKLKLHLARKNRQFWAKVSDRDLVNITFDVTQSMVEMGVKLDAMREEKARRDRLRAIRLSVS